jgi:hypothetical protein
MERCATCKWWEHGEGRNSLGVCLLTVTKIAEPVHPTTLALAYARNWEGYATTNPAELVTAPDFGCIQWEKRD